MCRFHNVENLADEFGEAYRVGSGSTRNDWTSPMGHHEQTAVGPANWFECQIPDEWSYSLKLDSLEICPPNSQLRVRIDAFWHSAKNVAPVEFLDPSTIFTNGFALRKLAPLRIPQAASYGIEGSVVVTEGLTLFQRLFWPGRKRKCQAWAIRYKSVCLICSVEQLSETSLSKELLDEVREVLASIRFTTFPVAPPEAFAVCLLRRVRRKFDSPANRIGGLKLAVGNARINLLSFYRKYQQSPESLDAITQSVLATIERLLNWNAESMDEDFELVQDRIMPMLVPEAVWQDSLREFASEPWIAGLRIVYVVDENDAYWYVREGLLDVWNLSRTELHKLALSNLADYFERRSIDITAVDGTNGPNLLMPVNADAYNSVQLLNQPFHRKLQQILGPEFAIGIPNRDFFVAVSLKNSEVLERVRGKVADDFRTMDHPLTDRILIVSTDGVSEYCDSE
ncbi:MAG: DUF1444 family protein [Planctomycetaceae bacterium]